MEPIENIYNQWPQLSQPEKIEVLRGVFKKLLKWLLPTIGMVGVGILLGIKDIIFYFCIGVISGVMLNERKG